MTSFTHPSGRSIRIVFILAVLLSTGYFCNGQTADFSSDYAPGCFPLKVEFTDESTGPVSSWSWSFGNGNTSSLQHPSAVYSAPGTYTVTLTVSNGPNSDTEIKTGYIVVHAYPVVDFVATPASGCTPLTVKFVDKSSPGSGVISSWYWVFGDGGTSSDQNPSHTYVSPGNKSITLKVRNQYGCESTKAMPSMIRPQGPAASFSASSTTVCQVPATIQFTNQSTGSGALSYTWDFGDGKSGTSVNPSNTFTQPATYNVVLKAKDNNGCESSYTVAINIGSQAGLDFQPSLFKVCTGEPVSFTVNANSPIVSRDWNFGNNSTSTEADPSVTYTTPGIYNVTLKAMLVGNTCHSIVTRKVEVVRDAAPSFKYTVDCQRNVTLTNTSTGATRWEWYLGGILSSTASSFTKTLGSGNHMVKLIAYNQLNCSKVSEKSIHVPGNPVAAFLPDLEQDCVLPSLSGCAPFTLALTNQSTSEMPFTSEWNFGDGKTSKDKDPTHTYSAKGTYTLTLKVTNSEGCTHSLSRKVTVSDIKPTAKFTVSKNKVCAKEEVTFTSQSQNATYFCWDFGDGNVSTGSQLTHGYTKPGIYTVRLTAKNAGCADTYEIVNAVEVTDPLTDFEITKNCTDPFTIALNNISSGHHSLEWDFGDGTVTSSDVNTHTYLSAGSYIVRLTATNNVSKCVVVEENAVSIWDIEADFEIDNPKPCKGASVNFTDKSSSVASWEWSFGNGAASYTQNPSTYYYQSGSYSILLRAYDADGCYEEKSVPVDVLDIQGNFTFDAVSTCDEFQVKFHDHSTATPPLLNWHWDFGDGQTSSDPEPEHIYTVQKAYPIILTLTNANGNCSFIQYDAINFTNPALDFSLTKPQICLEERMQIVNLSSNASLFEWDLDDGSPVTATHPVVSYDTSGMYNVTLSATDSYGCTKSVTRSSAITVTKPVAAFDAFETSSACPPLTTIFANRSSGNVQQWSWDFGDGQSSTFSDPANTYVRPGSFDVSLMVTDANGCTDTTRIEKLVNVGGPYGTYAVDHPQSSCVMDTVSFIASSTNAVVHQWDFGDGIVEDFAGMEAGHLYTQPGSFNIALVLIDENGCKVVADGNVSVAINDTSRIDFTYGPECIFQEEPFSAKAEATEEILAWEWLINGEVIGTEPSVTVTRDTAAEYRMVLEAVNQSGCISHAAHNIRVRSNLSLIPNIFTPNNDGYNDQFMIKDLEKSTWNLRVYNRWGDPVYRKDDYTNNWQGGDLSSGVYFYSVINAFCPDKKYKGTITIRR